MNLLDKIKVVSNTRLSYKKNSEGYIAWIHPFNPEDVSNVRMDIAFFRYGKTGKPRLSVNTVYANVFDWDEELLPELRKLEMTQETIDQYLATVEIQNVYSSRIAIKRIGKSMLQDLSSIPNMEFLLKLAALAWPIDAIFPSYISTLNRVYSSNPELSADNGIGSTAMALLRGEFRNSHLAPEQMQYLMNEIFLRDAGRITHFIGSCFEYDYRFYKKPEVRVKTLLNAVNENPGYRTAILTNLRRSIACFGKVAADALGRSVSDKYRATRNLVVTVPKRIANWEKAKAKNEKANKVNSDSEWTFKILDSSEEDWLVEPNTTVTASGAASTVRMHEPTNGAFQPPREEPTLRNVTYGYLVDTFPMMEKVRGDFYRKFGVRTDSSGLLISNVIDANGRTLAVRCAHTNSNCTIYYVLMSDIESFVSRVPSDSRNNRIDYYREVLREPTVEEVNATLNSLVSPPGTYTMAYVTYRCERRIEEDQRPYLHHIYATRDARVSLRYILEEPVPRLRSEPAHMNVVRTVVALPSPEAMATDIAQLTGRPYSFMDIRVVSTPVRDNFRRMTVHSYRTFDNSVYITYNVLDPEVPEEIRGENPPLVETITETVTFAEGASNVSTGTTNNNNEQ